MAFGFTFNGIHSSTLGIKVKNVQRDILPPTETKLLQVPHKQGAIFISNTHEPRKIEIDISISKSNLASVRSAVRDIANWLKSNVSPLVFDDETDKTYDAVFTGDSNLEQLWSMGQATLTFICPNPYAYSASTTVPLVIGSNSVAILGTAKTSPIVTINFTSTATEVKITNQNNGKYVRLIDAIPNLASVVIDFEKRLVTANGSNRMANVDLNSEFFDLEPGVNTIQLSSTGICTGNLSYKPRWL